METAVSNGGKEMNVIQTTKGGVTKLSVLFFPQITLSAESI
jgi:hypothetical protein